MDRLGGVGRAVVWTSLERVRDLVEVSLQPAGALIQNLFLLPTPLSSTPRPAP